MNKARLTILVQLLLAIQLNAQQLTYGLTFSAGIEHYRNDINTSRQTIDEAIIPVLSVGGLAKSFLYEGYFCKIGLNVNRSDRQFLLNTDHGLVAWTVSSQLKRKRKNYYLSTPVSVGYQIGRFSVELGLQLSYTFHVDDKESERLVQYVGTAGPEESFLPDPEDKRLFVESFLQTGLKIFPRQEIQLTLIRNGNGDNYDSLFPRYRLLFGIITLFGKSDSL